MTWLRKLLASREAKSIALELLRTALDGAQDLHERRQRLAEKALAGDLDDSLRKLESLL